MRRSVGPRGRLPLFGITAALAFGLAGCGSGGARSNVGPGAEQNASPVQVRAAGSHPKIALVSRDGDPFSAISVAVVHDLGAAASPWLAALLAERMPAGAQPLDSRVSGSGFVLGTWARTSEDAAAFVRSVNAALATPLKDAERAKIAALAHAGPQVRLLSSSAARAVADCTGDLGAAAAPGDPSLADLERYRRAIYATGNVAFAAVGSARVLDAASDALDDTASWPSGAPSDPWPQNDVIGVSATPGDAHALSVALRLGDPARALAAARALGERGSPLVVHAASLEPAWNIDGVAAVVRPRGACLRVDLSPAPSDAEGADRTVAAVAALVADEASRALASARGGGFELDRGVLESADPRAAADVAAWQALGGTLEAGPSRLFVSYGGDPASTTTFAARFAEARRDRARSTVELHGAIEAGQGELWALLASPCATSMESAMDAGSSALAVRTLSRENAMVDDVRIEPWASGYGIGLVAHAPRLARESAAAHAARVADALGSVFATAAISDFTAGLVKEEVQSELVPETDALWPIALDALAPKRPSLLDPRGTFQSLTGLPIHTIDTRRRALVRGPLRLATIANFSADQNAAFSVELERWLEPARTAASACPATTQVVALPGRYETKPAAAAPPGSKAIVAVSIPLPASHEVPREAEWFVYLLNRPSGWLDHAVALPGLAVSAEATLLGGRDAAAIVVEVTGPEQSARQAAEQVRALLGRLADGAITADDVSAAGAALDRASAGAAADPRQRLVRLWLAHAEAKRPDLGSLRDFAHRVFAADRHVLVVTGAR